MNKKTIDENLKKMIKKTLTTQPATSYINKEGKLVKIRYNNNLSDEHEGLFFNLDPDDNKTIYGNSIRKLDKIERDIPFEHATEKESRDVEREAKKRKYAKKCRCKKW